MYLLKNIIIFMTLFSCTASGPVTPEDSLRHIKKAYAEENISGFLSLLTQESLRRIDSALIKITAMDEKSRSGFSAYYGLKEDALKNLSPVDLIKIQFVFMKNNKTDLHEALTTEAVVAITGHKESVEIQMSNGVVLKFQREFPYWKMDLTFF